MVQQLKNAKDTEEMRLFCRLQIYKWQRHKCCYILGVGADLLAGEVSCGRCNNGLIRMRNQCWCQQPSSKPGCHLCDRLLWDHGHASLFYARHHLGDTSNAFALLRRIRAPSPTYTDFEICETGLNFFFPNQDFHSLCLFFFNCRA